MGKGYFEKRTIKKKKVWTLTYLLLSPLKSPKTRRKKLEINKTQIQKTKPYINTNRTLQIILTDDTAEQLIW